MKKYKSCLTGVPLFKNLKDENLIEISSLIEPILVDKHAIVIQSGQQIEHLYILHKGSLKVSSYSETGTQHQAQVLHPGEFIAEYALLQSQHSKFEVESLAQSEICRISGSAFRNYLKLNPDVSLNLIDQLLKKLNHVEKQSESFATLSSRERLLDALHSRVDPKNKLVLELSKKDFALALGMAPETLSRQLSKLEKDGLIKVDGRSIQML